MDAIRAAGHKPQVQSKPLEVEQSICINDCDCCAPVNPEKFKKTDDFARDNILKSQKPPKPTDAKSTSTNEGKDPAPTNGGKDSAPANGSKEPAPANSDSKSAPTNGENKPAPTNMDNKPTATKGDNAPTAIKGDSSSVTTNGAKPAQQSQNSGNLSQPSATTNSAQTSTQTAVQATSQPVTQATTQAAPQIATQSAQPQPVSTNVAQPVQTTMQNATATLTQNLQTVTPQLARYESGSKIQTSMIAMTTMAGNTAQTANVALQISNALVQIADKFHPQAAANIAKAVATLPPENMAAFGNLVSTLPNLNLSKEGMIMLTSVIGNAASKMAPATMEALGSVLKTLSDTGILKDICKDIKKMATLQALLTSTSIVDANELIKVLGPIMKQANGKDETEEDKIAKEQALERMIDFLDTYVSTGHAIWAEQMGLKKEEKEFQEMYKSAQQQLNRQALVYRHFEDEDNSAEASPELVALEH